jgi:hypothetical protein
VVYETGSGSCLGSGFGISGNETWVLLPKN